MTESEDINDVVNALKKVPEKKLLIVELANIIPIKNGFDTGHKPGGSRSQRLCRKYHAGCPYINRDKINTGSPS